MVLKLLGLFDARGSYFTFDRALEIRDVMGWAEPGRWLGRGAHDAGVTGAVTSDDLECLLSGRLPSGTISPSPRRTRNAFDLIVAAPKPVSVLFASPDPVTAAEVVTAHVAGVRAALGYIEDRCLSLARTAGDDRTPLRAQGAFVACFSHGVSRSGDPHLHSHLVIANVARGEDGRFGALDQRSLRAHLGAADAVYQAQVRGELRQRLGVTWDLGIDGAIRAAGVSDASCRALSGRTEERHRTKWRESKQDLSRSELLTEWSKRLRCAPIYDEPRRLTRDQNLLDEHRFESSLYDQTVTARRVVAALANAAVGGVSSGLLAEELTRVGDSLGWGLDEPPLMPRAWRVPTKVLKELGPRPMATADLARWWADRNDLERPLTRSRVPERGRDPAFTLLGGRGVTLG